jgi:hypothetical protein
MPKPARIEVYNSSSRPVELKCSETRARLTIPAYATRKVHESFLVNKPGSIIETYKMEMNTAEETATEQPVLQSRPKPKPSRPVDPSEKAEILIPPTPPAEDDKVVAGES